MKMKDSEVLRKALELMGPEGENWGRQVRFVPVHKLCPFLALESIQQMSTGYWARALGFDVSLNLFTWNDTPGRTFTDVKELFEKQIAFAEVLERGEEVAQARC